MIRATALLLTVLTGFSGLTYEVTWQKYLATLLGSHSEATAAVLAIFLGGLSVGYELFGAWTRRRVARARRQGRAPRLLLFYGLLETAIGLYALAFPSLFGAAQSASVRLAQGTTGTGFVLDVTLAALLIGPPTVLMGATIPVLTQALARSLTDATRFHALVYAFNTVGAFGGALAAGFYLVPALGLSGVMRAMALLNLVAGATFALLDARAREPVLPVAPQPTAAPDAPRPEGFALYAAAALLLGFAMMAFQTVLIRLGGLSLGASHFTFATVVAVFVLCIALGSFAVSALGTIRRGHLVFTLWGLVLCLYVLHERLPEGPFWAHVLRTAFTDNPSAFYPYYLSAFGALLAVIGLPVFLSGAALPLLFHQLRRSVGDLGASAGRLYSWNTVGSLLGALLGGYALLFWLDLHHVFRIAAGAVALAAGLVTARAYALDRRLVALALVAPVLGALALLPAWEPALLSSGLFRHRQATAFTSGGPEAYLRAQTARVVFYDDDPAASVAVTEHRSGERLVRSIVNNGKSDGSTDRDYTTMALAALLPALFADELERAFVIGLGTGVTAGELAALDSTHEVVVAEISPAVVDAAPLFDFANGGASHDPEVRILRSDAYRALLRSEGTYDAIVSEPSNPWMTGVEMLYSREFLEAARARLRPGGVYVQWFHQYETDDASVAIVLRTYDRVFDDVAVWFAQFGDLLLLGFREPGAADLERLERRTARPDIAAGLARARVPSLPRLLAHELMPPGVLHASLRGDDGPIHTLYHPILSHHAARAFFAGRTGLLPFTGAGETAALGARNSLLRAYAARFGGRLPDAQRSEVLDETCRYRVAQCGSLLAQWQHDDGDSRAFLAARDSALEAARSRGGAERLDEAAVARLAGLFDPASADVPQRSATQLDHLTRDYEDFYHHAAPFRAEALLGAWSRCEPENGDAAACTRGARRAREMLQLGGTP